MCEMFYSARSFNQPLAQWKLPSLWNSWGMFRDATSFNQPLTEWNLSRVHRGARMFDGATAFDKSHAPALREDQLCGAPYPPLPNGEDDPRNAPRPRLSDEDVLRMLNNGQVRCAQQ